MAIKFLPAAALLLAGCTIGPDFQRPDLWSPASWFSARPTPARGKASIPVAEPVDAEWWTAFRDPVLTGLVRRIAPGATVYSVGDARSLAAAKRSLGAAE